MQNRIRQLRKQQGMTAKQLASVIGVSRSAIYLYETGGRSPCIDILVRMSDIFGVTIDYLVGMTDKNAPAGFGKGKLTDDRAAVLETMHRLFPDLPE